MSMDTSHLAMECHALASSMAYSIREIAHGLESSAIDGKVIDALFGLAVAAEVIVEKSTSLVDASFSAKEA